MSTEAAKKKRKSDQGVHSQPLLDQHEVLNTDKISPNLTQLNDMLHDLDESDQQLVIHMVSTLVTHLKNKVSSYEDHMVKKVEEQVLKAVTSVFHKKQQVV